MKHQGQTTFGLSFSRKKNLKKIVEYLGVTLSYEILQIKIFEFDEIKSKIGN